MRGAIFDMDGLLLDTERLYRESWVEVAKAFGQTPVPEFPAAVSGSSGEGMRRIVKHYYPAVDAQDFIQSCVDRVDRILDQEGAPEKPGARVLLSCLRARGLRIAVASSSARERILANLRQAGIAAAFDAVVSGQEVERGKPEPDIFLLAARRLGLPPEECYVFEDSLNGVRSGMAAGCVTVMVPDQVPPTEGLKVSQICRDLREAMALIEAGRL